jgi:hypothetical protein
MLPDLLQDYLAEVEAAIRELEGVYVERYQEEILTAGRVNLRIRIRFSRGFLLELNEKAIHPSSTRRSKRFSKE